MGLRCKTEKVDDDIAYIMIRDDRSDFWIEIVINNQKYQTNKGSRHSAQRWIDQQIQDMI